MNNTLVDDADVVMSMYDVLEYSDIYSENIRKFMAIL